MDTTFTSDATTTCSASARSGSRRSRSSRCFFRLLTLPGARSSVAPTPTISSRCAPTSCFIGPLRSPTLLAFARSASRATNVLVGSSPSPSCRRPRPGRSSVSGCARRRRCDPAPDPLHAERGAGRRYRAGGAPPRRPPARRPRQDRHEGRLLGRGLRALHGAGRRRADVGVPATCHADRRRGDPHGRRSRVAAAGGVHRRRRFPVRHLHLRPVGGGRRSASHQANGDQRRDTRLADGQPVPLHGLLRHRTRDRKSATRAMRPFDYVEPETLEEALEILAADPDDTVVMAGGTSLVILMKQDLIRPARVLGLRRIAELRAIGAIDEGLVLGALATHGRLARSPAVRAHATALASTFAAVATVRIREQATLGGNLAHADPAQDPPVTLLALDGAAVARSRFGERRIPLDTLFTDLFETSLEPGELLLRVELPRLPVAARATYQKFLPATRDDYATVSVAAAVATDASGACTPAPIALGGAATVPLRAREAERSLMARRLDDAAIREAAVLAAAATDPIDDLRGSAAYKRAMVGVWTERALREVA